MLTITLQKFNKLIFRWKHIHGTTVVEFIISIVDVFDSIGVADEFDSIAVVGAFVCEAVGWFVVLTAAADDELDIAAVVGAFVCIAVVGWTVVGWVVVGAAVVGAIRARKSNNICRNMFW